MFVAFETEILVPIDFPTKRNAIRSNTPVKFSGASKNFSRRITKVTVPYARSAAEARRKMMTQSDMNFVNIKALLEKLAEHRKFLVTPL